MTSLPSSTGHDMKATVVDLSDINDLGESFVIVPRQQPDPSRLAKSSQVVELAKANRLIINDYKPGPTLAADDFKIISPEPAKATDPIESSVVIRTDASALATSAVQATSLSDTAPPPPPPQAPISISIVDLTQSITNSLKESVPVETQVVKANVEKIENPAPPLELAPVSVVLPAAVEPPKPHLVLVQPLPQAEIKKPSPEEEALSQLAKTLLRYT